MATLPNTRDHVNGPQDVLMIGDSMLKRFQVYGHRQTVWKFCYPGATAEELHNHILTEKLPGEARVGAVLINVGTNDLSRSRGRIRTTNEVFEFISKFVLRLANMYPQAEIVYLGILPRLDCDNDRAHAMNVRMNMFMNRQSKRFTSLLYSDLFQDTKYPGPTFVPKSEYYRNLSDDVVHLSDSGTQVQQDVLNNYLVRINKRLQTKQVDCTQLMWQLEWERFNEWNLKTPSVRASNYLIGKRITNFTPAKYDEVLKVEETQKTNHDPVRSMRRRL